MALRVGGAPAVPSKISPCHQTPAASRLKYFWLDLTQVTFRLLSLSGWAVSSLLLLQSLWVLLDELLCPLCAPDCQGGSGGTRLWNTAPWRDRDAAKVPIPCLHTPLKFRKNPS